MSENPHLETDHIGGASWTFEKRDRTVIAGRRRYRESEFLDIREWVRTGDGDLKATVRGVTIPVGAVPAFAAALLRGFQT